MSYHPNKEEMHLSLSGVSCKLRFVSYINKIAKTQLYLTHPKLIPTLSKNSSSWPVAVRIVEGVDVARCKEPGYTI